MRGRPLMRALRNMRDLALTIAIVAGAAPVWFLPPRAAAAVGRWYGYAGFFLWPIGRRAGMINLRRAYGPAMTRARARRTIWKVFGSLGQSVAEGIRFARRFKHGQAGWENLYEAEDRDLETRLLADPRPKIFVTGHLGSWEIATMMGGHRVGDRGAVIARRVDNPFLDAVVRRLRLRGASQWIEKRGAVTEALRRLQQGHSIALLADENAGRRGVFVHFFGRPASTTRMPALLALMTGSPIVLGAAVRRPGRNKLLIRLAVLEPAAFVHEGSRAVAAMSQQMVARLEHWIRENPEQWRWVHWRWKHRPDGRTETYGRRDLKECFKMADADPVLEARNVKRTPT